MIHQTLKQYFGFDQFRDGQQTVIEAAVAGQSAAAIFPTGSGKSLCYQLAALHMPNLTLVVSPLLALMKDQLDFLASKNIAAASIDSSQTSEQASAVMQGINNGQIKILMISVERLKNERFRQLMSRVPVSLLVVDEAHCISEWGHNFRPDYLKLPQYQQEFNIPQAMLLTATATPAVIQDMQNKFSIAPANVVVTGFYRPNLHLGVEAVSQDNKNQQLLANLAQNFNQGQAEDPAQTANQATIIYVTLQKTAEDVASYLTNNGVSATAYHAGMKHEVRQDVQLKFMQSEIHCIVATIAFGMGIDKSNIRRVIHYDLPKSIENYSQEIGRAGRDGLPSRCVVLANSDNLNVLENFVYGDTPELSGIETVLQQINETTASGSDQWEIMIYPLSNQCNIRQLPLKTLLVYLQLKGIIEPLYAYFAEFRYKLLVSEQQLINQFQGERQDFVNALLQTSDKARVWSTINFDRLYQRYSAERSRVLTALEYFHDKQYIELESKQMTDVFRITQPQFDGRQVADELFATFKSKEQSEIERIHHMLALFQSNQCLSQQLSAYFGDHQLTAPCGHCSVCDGSVAVLPQKQPLKPLDSVDLGSLCHELIEASPTPPSVDCLTRFLCGMTVPLFTKVKARRMRGFGVLEQYRYAEIKACVER
ncbi:MAG: ATP-dependent DNA helicase RecQ [Phenylobacterium sp.]|jgi:ATP-dependent DNA helicase RecQ